MVRVVVLVQYEDKTEKCFYDRFKATNMKELENAVFKRFAGQLIKKRIKINKNTWEVKKPKGKSIENILISIWFLTEPDFRKVKNV